MLNIFNHFKEKFWIVVGEIAAQNGVEIAAQDFFAFNVEPSKDKTHGDLACNIAMAFVKKFSAVENLNNPRKLAGEIIARFNDGAVVKMEIAGAGFINIFLNPQFFYRVLGEMFEADIVAFPNIGKGAKVNLEYASPNPTGPIHVGHTRGAIYGDVLAKLLSKVGFDVTKEYYVNDAGGQIEVLVRSAYLRYLEKIYANDIAIYVDADGPAIQETPYNHEPRGSWGASISGQLIDFYKKEFNRKNFYPGEYLKDIAKELYEKYEDSLNDYNNIEDHLITIRDFVVKKMLDMIIKDLAALGIKHDNIFREKEKLHDSGAIEEVIKILQNKSLKVPSLRAVAKQSMSEDAEKLDCHAAKATRNDELEGGVVHNKVNCDDKLIYLGKLEAPKTEKGVGALPEGYDDKEQTLFRATLFGDDQDRVVKKSDGTYTYFAADLAYIKNKFDRGFTKMIMPLGFDHAGYVKRMQAAVSALTDNKAELKIILCQMVKFIKEGKPLKMSKRAGNFITAREVIDEVGADVLRFIMLTRKNDAPFDFDLAKVVEQSKDNPIFYVQYAHTRCCSVLRNTRLNSQLQNCENKKIDMSLLANLKDESEIEIIKKILEFPRVIEMAVANYEPHRIAFYLQEIAALFHAFWNKGVENPNLKFIIKDNLVLTKSRIYFVMAVKLIIATGLDIFNIKALEEM